MATLKLLVFSAMLVALIIYLLFHKIAFKNLYKTLHNYNRYKYGFYECGFKPQYELSTNFTLHGYVMFSLVLLYDVEGMFLFLFLLNFNMFCVIDLFFVFFYLGLFFLGFWLESTSQYAEWMLY